MTYLGEQVNCIIMHSVESGRGSNLVMQPLCIYWRLADNRTRELPRYDVGYIESSQTGIKIKKQKSKIGVRKA